MARRRKAHKTERGRGAPPADPGVRLLYERARRCAEQGQGDEARRLYEGLAKTVAEPRLKALLCNDRGALAALAGDYPAARRGFRDALAVDPGCEPARANLALLEEDFGSDEGEPSQGSTPVLPLPAAAPAPAGKVAILSFLFNWPTTGGGNVHTAELVRFLARAGYDVRHFYPRYAPWGIGRVEDPPFPGEALDFDDAAWSAPAIKARFRQAVDGFRPDWVVVMDAWNFKPHLAEAMRGYPVFLRFQALECLCPLNNVRLLPGGPARFAQCDRQQLADPGGCQACLQERGHLSGGLHQAERALAGVGTPGYHEALCRALREAEAVLVLNPVTGEMLRPHARRVCVVPWGMDPDRFPWPPTGPERETPGRPAVRLFMAALVEESMKGFRVLHEACARLWRQRQDFELVATGDPPGPVDAFTRFTGWASQGELPRLYREADVCAVPTVAQEGLSRTSVEAMASGLPVVASRIGGLPSTVLDGATGLLCEPGDPDDLAHKLEALLDDPGLRRRMGLAGRRRFEEEFTWDVVIERHYRPLFQKQINHG
jgi:glycosyltransferase involved in cell wall biosynthesis